jgi:hypothetical protein
MEPNIHECPVFIICKNFLQEINDYFAENLDNITCSELYDHYSYMFQILKEIKGNSSGFTGLSEYLIFRYIYNYLGGSFETVQLTKDLFEFRSTDGIYRIGQSIPVITETRKYYPDIVVYKQDQLILAAEIKFYLADGIKSLEVDLKKLREIHKQYPTAKCLFISYNIIPEKGKIYKKLLEEVNSNDWLDFIILAENNELFKEKMHQHLDI